MSTTYLSLVNRAIQESGTNLTDLTSGTFGSTTDSMQIKFKRWVADAWKDIQTDRRGWHFRKKKGVYILQPRIEFYDGSAQDETAFDNIVISDTNSNWTYSVNGSVYIENGTFAAGTAEGWFNVKDEDNLLPISSQIKSSDTVSVTMGGVVMDTYDNSRHSGSFADVFAAGMRFYIEGIATEYGVINSSSVGGGQYTLVLAFHTEELETEFVDLLTLNPLLQIVTDYNDYDPINTPSDYLTDFLSAEASTEGVLRIVGWGRYRLDTVGPDSDPDSAVADLQEIDTPTLRISPFSGAADVDYSTERKFSPVRYLSNYQWNAYGYGGNKSLGQPTFYTIDTDGKYSFYPQPDKAYALNFDYWRTPQTLSDYGDVVEGIADHYTDAIVWKAVMYWADYDENSSKYNRASRRFMSIYNKLLRDYLEDVRFPPGVGEASFVE